MPTLRHSRDTKPKAFNDHAAEIPDRDQRSKHGDHGLMMMVMCIPMLLIAGVLVVTGSAGGLVIALVCIAMMAMMFMMPGGHRHK
jgi:hypothetical protein